VFLLVYHRIALLASTYSRAKGVCLFSFIVPELDFSDICMAAPADKTWKPHHPWGVGLSYGKAKAGEYRET
jgi:hypothetical protein